MLLVLDDLVPLQREFPCLYSKLSPQRREKVDRLRFAEDKVSSACAFLLLRILLAEECQFFDMPVFDEKRGKPSLRVRTDIRFNLAHDRKGVVCALSECEVGADIQDLISCEKGLTERILSECERATLAPVLSDAILTRMWTLKESFGKYGGEGVFEHLTDTDFSSMTEDGTYLYKGLTLQTGRKNDIFYAVCSEKVQEIAFISSSEFLKKVRSLSEV